MKDGELASAEEVIAELRREQESLKRQLEDLHNTVEYQEAKMDSQGGHSGPAGPPGILYSPRHNGHRRSVRKSKKSAADRAVGQ